MFTMTMKLVILIAIGVYGHTSNSQNKVVNSLAMHVCIYAMQERMANNDLGNNFDKRHRN